MLYSYCFFVPVAQLDRVLDYESRGRGFESLQVRQAKAPNFDFNSGLYSLNLIISYIIKSL